MRLFILKNNILYSLKESLHNTLACLRNDNLDACKRIAEISVGSAAASVAQQYGISSRLMNVQNKKNTNVTFVRKKNNMCGLQEKRKILYVFVQTKMIFLG